MPDEQAQSSTQLRGTVENKAPKPAGLLPKNRQQRGSRFRRQTLHGSRRWALRATYRQAAQAYLQMEQCPNRAESLEAEQERNRLRRPTPSKKTKRSGNTFPCLRRMSLLHIESRRKPSTSWDHTG